MTSEAPSAPPRPPTRAVPSGAPCPSGVPRPSDAAHPPGASGVPGVSGAPSAPGAPRAPRESREFGGEYRLPEAAPQVKRPTVEELRLTSFKSYRRATLPLSPLTVLHGPSGAGKSNALDALSVLSRLALGEEIKPSLDGIGGLSGPLAVAVRGGLAGCVPHGRNAIILGCTVRSRAGSIRLEVVVRTDERVRIAREWLTLDGQTVMETGEQDLGRGRINVTWHNDSRQGDIRAPMPSNRLVTAQLPLRVAGSTNGERKVLAASEQLLTALREVFALHPVPAAMRGWTRPEPQARLLGTAANISAVLGRLKQECQRRWARLLRAVQTAAPHPLLGLDVARRGEGDRQRLLAVFDEGVLGRTGADQASDGMLRLLAFAAVLLTGADVLDVDPAGEVPDAHRQLVLLAEDLGAGLAADQIGALLGLAREVTGKGDMRLLAALQEPGPALALDGVELVECRRDPATGHSLLRRTDPGGRVPVQGGAREDAPVVDLGA
ncbi:ATP-binding protein [Kitasatospora sp. NPDC088391]|uniref:AAA family ATPase n=1 Tax=Kitasatospora sp. NPDC088391 TaxID=3364074 RepID=UPI00381A6752